MLGRFDGVDRQSDNLRGSGFDSRALQPQFDHVALRCRLPMCYVQVRLSDWHAHRSAARHRRNAVPRHFTSISRRFSQ